MNPNLVVILNLNSLTNKKSVIEFFKMAAILN